ncbi:MAG: ABC transporter ATP-binding protein [Pyrinomonadaceae bacterium]
MIQLREITKTVRSGTEDLTILSNVSIGIPEGQFVALTGASGSGKSTLLGLIAGLDAPTSGQILIDGDDITAMGEDGLADIRSEKIGFVFQSFHLIPSLTAFENVLIPMEIQGAAGAKERAAQLLNEVGLSDRGHHYPNELSGGEQQRVAIARAFANRPKILLADEPTGNLDSKNGRHIFELMEDLHRQSNITLVLVTHDAALAAMAQRQVVLKDGVVISDEVNG